MINSTRAVSDGVLPFCHYFLGATQLQMGALTDAEASLTQAKYYSGHDMYRALGFRFHSMGQNIVKARTNAALVGAAASLSDLKSEH